MRSRISIGPQDTGFLVFFNLIIGNNILYSCITMSREELQRAAGSWSYPQGQPGVCEDEMCTDEDAVWHK